MTAAAFAHLIVAELLRCWLSIQCITLESDLNIYTYLNFTNGSMNKIDVMV